MTSPLHNRTFTGMAWSFTEALGSRLVQFGVGIVLARLLLPEEFGLIGMLVFFIAIAQVFLDSGFGAALIQRQDATEKDICSIFYFNIAVGMLVFGILYLVAPWIAEFYHQPDLKLLTRCLSITIVINSLGLIQNTLLRKAIDFKAITISTLVAGGVSGGVGIAMAIGGFGVLSLAAQQISSALIRTAALWFVNKWRPVLVFSFRSLYEMFGFGSRVLAGGLLNQTFDNIYLLVIGKLFSAADLGLFTRAKQTQQLPSQTIYNMVGKVTFPVFSTIKNDSQRLKRGMKKAVGFLVFINFPMMIGLCVVARPLVLILLTEKWIKCVPYLQLLCLDGLMYPLHAINLNVLQAMGRSDLFLRVEVIKKVLITMNIVVTWRWGILAMIGGNVIVSFISYYLNSYYNGRLIDYSISEQSRDLAPYLSAAILMGGGVYAIGWIDFRNIEIQLMAQILAGVLFYTVICKLLGLTAFMEIYNIAVGSLSKKKVYINTIE